VIPWILGSPPEWEFVYRDERSVISNIPSGEVQATSTLSAKIRLSIAMTLRCKALLSIAMPFDMFKFKVNSEIRSTFYAPEKDWITLTSSLGPGENIIQFQVANGDVFPDMDRTVGPYGNGQVWIDQCVFVPDE